MSYRTRRVLFITPFYMLFEFFLLKYIFLLFGGVEDNYILILTVLIGLNHFMPMLFEERKSHKVTRFLSTLDGVWMLASVLFLIDILVIYLFGSFVNLSLETKEKALDEVLRCCFQRVTLAYSCRKRFHLGGFCSSIQILCK